MQIKDLPSTSTVNSTDVLAIETSGGTTNKVAISDFVVNNLTNTSTTKPLSAAQGKELNNAKATRRIKSVTLGAGNTASVSDVINSGEVGILFVQQNSFTVQNLGYMALVRRSGTGYYVTSPSWSTSETLRPTLDANGVLSVTNTQYSGTYVCMFMPFA